MRPSTLFAAAALALGVSASPIANSTTTATSTATTTTTGTNSVSTGNPWDSCSNICVLIAGDDPKVIVPFKRPPCACACMKSACTSVTSNEADAETCLRLGWPNDANPWGWNALISYATCTGSQHCVG